MIWVSWRQHRLQVLAGLIGAAAIGAFLLETGPGILHAFRATGLAHCLATPGAECGDLTDAFLNRYTGLQFVAILFLVLPVFAGLFWGAPLLPRELEQGTHRLAWTQGVGRTRWLATRLALVGALTAASFSLFAWWLSWWSRPLVIASDDRFAQGIFDIRGIVPVAYALFAIGLGVAAGALIRRTLPAMAATLGGFIAVRVVVEFWVRKHYLAAKVLSEPFFKGMSGVGKGAWVLSARTVDAAGHLLGPGGGVEGNLIQSRCPELGLQNNAFPGKDAIQACLQRIGARTINVYQPGSRYRSFQWIESGNFPRLPAGLVALSIWWVRRRIV